MRHEHENARRHAYNTLAEVNRHLDKGNIRDPRHHQMLTDMAEKATRTLRNLDEMDDARPYSDTNIGYGADMRQNRRSIHDAMDAINKVLPHIIHNLDMDVEMRRGVPGTGRSRRFRADSYDDDTRYDNNMDDMNDDFYDDMDEVVNRRGRPRRTRRGVGRWTQVRTHVRRMPRSDMDDDMNNDDRQYDNYEFYNDVRRAVNDARRTADEARRIADDARRTVDDRRSIYPGTPVMVHDEHKTARHETKNDMRDDITTDRERRPGPGMD